MPETLGHGVVSNEVISSVTKPAPTPAKDPASTADTSAASSPPPTDDAIPEAELPQRLRGAKSFKDAVSKFKEIESELGRKNNEVGQLRYVIDEMLKLKRTEDVGHAPPASTHTPVTPDSLLADPETSISSVAKRTAKEATSEVSDRVSRMEYELQKEKFSQRHPNYEATMESPEFIDWIKASPYRIRLAAAATQGSFDAADELFGLHKEVVAAKAPPPAADPKALAAASTTRPGTGSSTGGSRKGQAPSASSKEIFSRVELAKLYATNRDAYNAMGPEIRQAYAEGRVR